MFQEKVDSCDSLDNKVFKRKSLLGKSAVNWGGIQNVYDIIQIDDIYFPRLFSDQWADVTKMGGSCV